MITAKKVNVLGTEYTVEKKKYSEDSSFKEYSICGYCEEYTKRIVICDLKSIDGMENESEDSIRNGERQTLRHEIVHAFLNESGLNQSSLKPDVAWARNEEMVEWIAIQLPKMLRAFQECGVL